MTQTSAAQTSAVAISSAAAASTAASTKGAPISPSTTIEGSSDPSSSSLHDNGSSNKAATSTRAQTTNGAHTTSKSRTTAAGGIINGLGTTREHGTLIVATTDAEGHTTTLTGAAASSATRGVVHTYTSALLTTKQSQYTYRTTRVVDGTTSVGEYTTSRAITLTTGYATATNAAELASGGGSNNSSGLTSSDKSIIGGVVGGVGGVILIGAILLVVYRLRKKRSNTYRDDDFDDNYNTRESKRISRGSQQLGDGMERYHNPATTAHSQPAHSSTNF